MIRVRRLRRIPFRYTETVHLDPDAAVARSGKPVDMVKELGDVLERTKTSAPKIGPLEDRRKAKFAFKCVVAIVYQDARVVISTNNNLGGGLVRKHFGTNAEFIVVIRVEDLKELEARGWVPVTKMACSPKVTGIILVGDHKQLKLTIISDCPNSKNEFAKQLTESLSDLRADTMSVTCQSITSST